MRRGNRVNQLFAGILADIFKKDYWHSNKFVIVIIFPFILIKREFNTNPKIKKYENQLFKIQENFKKNNKNILYIGL